MALPKKKISRSRGGMRRSHQALAIPSLSTCPNCQEPRLPHQVCQKCGWYKNRVVMEIKE